MIVFLVFLQVLDPTFITILLTKLHLGLSETIAQPVRISNIFLRILCRFLVCNPCRFLVRVFYTQSHILHESVVTTPHNHFAWLFTYKGTHIAQILLQIPAHFFCAGLQYHTRVFCVIVREILVQF